MSLNDVYSIPSGFSFVDALVDGLFEAYGESPDTLARTQILLPTRRACRSLRESFLRRSAGKPLLLPRMHPVGDVDEEELSILLAGEDAAHDQIALPPAIAPIERLFLLSALIERRGFGRGPVQDMELASALAKLMDQTYTEDLNLKDLPSLVDSAALSDHWQVSLDFLEILSLHWPLILQERGQMDSADRRNRLMKSLCGHWRANPPSHPVIAAGTTGSIPATAALLQTIQTLPEGVIVLPGLDQDMDAESWDALDDTHPQATMKSLLGKLNRERSDIKPWPVCKTNQKKAVRLFTQEVMRPAKTTQKWVEAPHRILSNPDSQTIQIERYDCDSSQEEALTIALALRRTLEDPDKTAALITPDRGLARRVMMACHRWGIDIDDSAGTALAHTRAGRFLTLALTTACQGLRPVSLLDFCKHSLCRPDTPFDWVTTLDQFDLYAARGPFFRDGMDGYRTLLKSAHKKPEATSDILDLIDRIEQSFKPLFDIAAPESTKPFIEWVRDHLQVCERFCAKDILWAGEDGEAASVFFSSLLEQSLLGKDMTRMEYAGLLAQLMQSVTVRPRYGRHPRLSILGQMEARLVETDVMILSGLNEGTWPQKPSIDPWMSRPMRTQFGLPSPERSTGLSAHDFAQALCAKEVVITRSKRVDGTPTVPSRWLQRMDTIVAACQHHNPLFRPITDRGLLHWARILDHAPSDLRPYARPAPMPPVAVRPRKLSVTKIEKWIQDPYSIYAEYILRLRPLTPLEQPFDSVLYGTMVHSVLDQLGALYRTHITPDFVPELIRIAVAELDALGIENYMRALMIPRLEKIGEWLRNQETEHRRTYRPLAAEIKGATTIKTDGDDFTLTARADRIDISHDGTELALIDYKSSGQFTAKGMVDGTYPQLPLEAMMAQDHGFPDIKALSSGLLAYWVVNGSGEGGKTNALTKPEDIEKAIENARQGLKDLIEAFDNPAMPYMSLPRPHKAPKYNNYLHLARVDEWMSLDTESLDDGEVA